MYNRQMTYLIPGGLLVGLGVGLWIDQVAAGVMLGLGIGFLLSAFMGSFQFRFTWTDRLESRVEELEAEMKELKHRSNP
ncbi:hypothetical protein [Halalkalibacillus halophilus]|uniref:hypothetical protein n=1 Tax=Halalkalibacillus halophilus TaxID=392827 RepID=UPI000429D3BA|nr:hypothetical protein [Halalkalibacillus halophilus]